MTIEANGDAREINCTGAADELVVTVLLLGMDDRCPTGTDRATATARGAAWPA